MARSGRPRTSHAPAHSPGKQHPVSAGRRLTIRHAGPGESDRAQGDGAGWLKMLRAMPNGRQVVLAIFGPGQLFGTVDAIGRQAGRGSLIALTEEVTRLELKRAALFRLLEQHADLATNLLVALTPHFSECKNCIVELACLRIESRLARLLMKLATSAGCENAARLSVAKGLQSNDL